MNVMLSFTLEASFFGQRDKQGGLTHFTVEDYEGCGMTLISTFHQYLPVRQQRLMILVEKVMKAFAVEFPDRLRRSEKRKIRVMQEVES